MLNIKFCFTLIFVNFVLNKGENNNNYGNKSKWKFIDDTDQVGLMLISKERRKSSTF